MKSFSQYLEEKNMIAKAIAAGVIGGIGLGMMPRSQVKQPEQPQQTVKQEEPKKEIKAESPPKVEQNLDSFHTTLKQKHGNEYDTIMDAAINNGISKTDKQNLSLLFAIRKAENGGPGVEFGVLHPKAKGTNLRTQAGWAAATIMKNRARHNPKEHGDFISFLGGRYAPKGAENDPKGLNSNWISNVSTHYNQNIGQN
jgi:hypothetical protein